MSGTKTTILMGTSTILAAIGCSPGELEMPGELSSEDTVIELGLDAHTERVIVRFNTTPPRHLALGTDQVVVQELHSRLSLATLSVPAHMNAAEMVTQLRDRPDVRFAELDRVRSISATQHDDPGFENQWNMRQIGAEEVWQQDHTGETTIVAVVDTGVSEGGPDGVSITQGDHAGWDFVSNDGDPSDSHGHGTHVAGTVAQNTGNGTGVTGVAHGAEIMAVRVLDANGSGYVSDVASGILWAADHGADVINLSLGSSVGSQAEQDAVTYATEMGVLVVAATGNEYQANGVSYPAAYPEVLAVGASNGIDEIVDYTNQGPELDLVAPGGDFNRDDNGDGQVDGILQETVINGEWDYYLFQGTSMASPHVAGAAAVLMGMGASADEAREILELTASDLYDEGHDSDSGWGRLDLAAAVDELENRLDESEEDGHDPIDEEPIDEEPIDEEPIDEEPIDEEPIDEEPGDLFDEDGRPIDPLPDHEDTRAPEFNWIRATRTATRAHVEVKTSEVAGVMLCERNTQNCAKSPYGATHVLQMRTNEARLDLLARDPSGNVRIIPLDL